MSCTALASKAYLLQPLVELIRNTGIIACEEKAQEVASNIHSDAIINIGGGAKSVRWPTALNCDALLDHELDFNTSDLPYAASTASLVVCEQVIEHLHNTTWFLSELYRILKPGGTLLLSTENLASIPNIFALICGKAPFSTQAVCGRFIGGWRDGEAGYGVQSKKNSLTFSGSKGHVRVMTTGQLKQLLEMAGFHIEDKWGFGGNHYILFQATKLAGDEGDCKTTLDW